MTLEGFCSPAFPSGIAEPVPALVIVVLWGLCVFLDSVVFPLFEADNFQHIPKLTGNFGIILMKGQKVGEMAHNFLFGRLELNIPGHMYLLL